MTKFFEIEERDGPARLGKLYISSAENKNKDRVPFVQTPFMVCAAELASDPAYPIKNTGTFWKYGKNQEENIQKLAEEIQKTDSGKLIILPRNQFTRTYPSKSNDARQQRIYDAPEIAEIIGRRPTAGVIRPIKYSKPIDSELSCGEKPEENFEKIENPSDFEVEKKGCDVYIMESAGSFEDDSIGFFNSFLNVKSRIPADAALWLPNLASPENAAVLIYLGADILDTTRAEVAAYSGKYMTAAGTFYLEDLKELPCKCRACTGKTAEDLRQMPADERGKLLAEHNINTLDAEMSLVREKIRAGALREYIEGQCRTRTWLTGLLRLFDASLLAEQTAPAFRREKIYATTAESQNRAEIHRFAQRIIENYVPPKKEILIIFPCSSKKPYSISMSHQKFIQSIERNRKYVNELIITSPMGIIPRELELTYPAAHYDTTVTGHWDLEERAWVGGLLENYLEKNRAQYKHIIAHVEGPYREICEDAAEKLGLDMIFTVEKSPTAQLSLKNLRLAVDKIVEEATPEKESETHRPKPALMKRGSMEEKTDQAKAIARYQLGPLADDLFTDEFVMKGNFPKFMLLDGKTQLAVLVPQFGQLAFSIAAAEKLIKSEKYTGQYTVKIDNFLPKGSLLAPGIIEADPTIRPGDEVIILGENVIGVGKAKMSGIEMNSSTKGVAVLPRHTKYINEI